jgi:ABC-type sugar transport system ATPase subunit
VPRDGRVQQCDPPERLFGAPANRFVAAFMGTPPMNLVGAELRGGVLGLAGGRRAAGAERSGSDGSVVAGVQPADLALAGPATDPGAPRLRATLEVVERLGSESHVILPVEAPALTREAATVHLFDAETRLAPR